MLILLSAFACSNGDHPPIETDEMETQTIQVALQVPDAAWQVQIEEVWQLPMEIWVIARVSRNEGMAAQMINTVEDSVEVLAPDLPQKVFVVGKTWGWENEVDYTFVESMESVKEKMGDGELIYEKDDE